MVYISRKCGFIVFIVFFFFYKNKNNNRNSPGSYHLSVSNSMISLIKNTSSFGSSVCHSSSRSTSHYLAGVHVNTRESVHRLQGLSLFASGGS